jgi:hypothetical protein
MREVDLALLESWNTAALDLLIREKLTYESWHERVNGTEVIMFN